MDSERAELGWDNAATRQRFLEVAPDYGYGDEGALPAALAREYPSLTGELGIRDGYAELIPN